MPKKKSANAIAVNRRASFDYELAERFEAGVQLQGWEVKALRQGRAAIADAYVLFRGGEVWLFGARIEPLPTVSTHIEPEPDRTRKLLLSRREISRIGGEVSAKGYTCLPLRLYWKGSLVKCEIALARGKKLHDKRQAEREREWKRDQERNLRRDMR